MIISLCGRIRPMLSFFSVLMVGGPGIVPLGSAAGPAKQEAFSFVQMCDTQLGMGGYEHDVMTFTLAVKQINAMKPDFVVICGDLVQTADDKSFADFNRIRAGFKLPCHCAAGNHDVSNNPTPESLRRYREQIGKDYYSVEHKGYTVVVANTQLWKAPLAGESAKHDAWFKETLEAAKAKDSPVLVVVHYPLFLKTPDEKEIYYNLPIPKRKELLALCVENGVIGFLAGHTHRHIANEYQGIQMVNGETTSKNFDKRPMGFRLWNVGAQRELRHRFVPLEGLPALETKVSRAPRSGTVILKAPRAPSLGKKAKMRILNNNINSPPLAPSQSP